MTKQLKGLEESIQQFNKWKGAAKICFNRNENEYFTVVFHNDVAATESVLFEESFAIYSKDEHEANKTIGESRKEYIKAFVDLVLNKGYEPFQADYKLSYMYS